MTSGGGNGNRRGGGGGGYSGFPPFPDPFANFGMGSRGRSIFDVFDNDPFFNDPFFTRPFGSMFGGQGGLFGTPQGFLGNGGGFDTQQTAPRAPTAGYLENGPHSPSVSALLPFVTLVIPVVIGISVRMALMNTENETLIMHRGWSFGNFHEWVTGP